MLTDHQETLYHNNTQFDRILDLFGSIVNTELLHTNYGAEKAKPKL
jgi:hypothetical protein